MTERDFERFRLENYPDTFAVVAELTNGELWRVVRIRRPTPKERYDKDATGYVQTTNGQWVEARAVRSLITCQNVRALQLALWGKTENG